MSRILRKKTDTEKRKKKVESDGNEVIPVENHRHSETSTPLKSQNPPVSSLKPKQEKNLVETKAAEIPFIQKSLEFIREVKVELKKVTWPTQKQVTGTTAIVIVFIFIVAAFLGFFDFGLSKLVQVVLT